MVAIFIAIAVILGAMGVAWWNTKDSFIVKTKKNEIISFETSMHLTGMPIVIFNQGNKTYNFIYDSGSNVSYVNSDCDIKYDEIADNIDNTITGIDGGNISAKIVNVTLYLNNRKYEHPMRLLPLGRAFNEIKESTNVTVHGLIGGDFMRKYKYCLDYKDLVVYARK